MPVPLSSWGCQLIFSRCALHEALDGDPVCDCSGILSLSLPCPVRLPLKSGSVPRGGLEAQGPHILEAL